MPWRRRCRRALGLAIRLTESALPAPDAPRQVGPAIARAVAFVVIFILCAAASATFVGPIADRLARYAGAPMRAEVLAELVAALAATAIMLRSIDRAEWRTVELHRAAAGVRPLLAGFAGGSAIMLAVCGALYAMGMLAIVDSPVTSSWIAAALRVSVVLLVASLAEEVICRGYLLSVIRDGVGMPAAVVITSALFGLLHLSNAGSTPQSVAVVTLAGLLLASVRIVFRSLYAAWLAHFAWNWIMAVPLHAPVSGIQFESPGYKAVTSGPEWLSGGSWGPEGGVVAAAGMLGGLAYFYVRHRREES